MAKTPEALVEPALLVWARESLNLDVRASAKRAGVTAERLESWESGESRPSVAQLRTLAEVYKRPLAVFFLPEPPKGFSAMRDYRSAASSPPSPELTYAIRRAHERRAAALDLATDLEFTPPNFTLSVTTAHDPEKVGGLIRETLGVSDSDQLKWPTPSTAHAAWRRAFEAVGVLVFETQKVDLREARGFSLPEDGLPAIVLNGQDAVNGRTFTLFHELAHIALRRGGLCDLHDRGTSEATRLEAFCNRAAAAALMPSKLVLSEREVAGKGARSTYEDRDITRLAKRFSVSKEAVLRRLVDLALASPLFYQAKRVDYFAEFLKFRAKQKEKKGGPVTGEHEKALKYNGSLFARLVMTAYQRESITAVEAWNYLNLRPKHFEKLEAEVFRYSA